MLPVHALWISHPQARNAKPAHELWLCKTRFVVLLIAGSPERVPSNRTYSDRSEKRALERASRT